MTKIFALLLSTTFSLSCFAYGELPDTQRRDSVYNDYLSTTPNASECEALKSIAQQKFNTGTHPTHVLNTADPYAECDQKKLNPKEYRAILYVNILPKNTPVPVKQDTAAADKAKEEKVKAEQMETESRAKAIFEKRKSYCLADGKRAYDCGCGEFYPGVKRSTCSK